MVECATANTGDNGSYGKGQVGVKGLLFLNGRPPNQYNSLPYKMIKSPFSPAYRYKK
jgi:hypothetical protein